MPESIRYKTYNNVIETLKCLGEQHFQIQTTSTGDISKVDLEKNTKFPLYHISPISAEVNLQTKSFNFQIFVMDLVHPDEDCEQYVLSDTLQIITDIISLLKHGEILYGYNTAHGEEARYWIEDDFLIEPFTERFDNDVTGWVVDIKIQIESELDSCTIPINSEVICVK